MGDINVSNDITELTLVYIHTGYPYLSTVHVNDAQVYK